MRRKTIRLTKQTNLIRNHNRAKVKGKEICNKAIKSHTRQNNMAANKIKK
jgi:hypothetical protein